MEIKINSGVYPTMITPYKNGEIDYKAVEALTEWYWNQGCEGVFAACQSSEIAFLSLEERVLLTRTVVAKARLLAETDKSRQPMTVVASGHISDSFEEQVTELSAIVAESPDALILVTNRMDIENTTEDKWIEDTERLIAQLPTDMPLGIYECPLPYKRLLSDRMIEWCANNGRFYFLKDTCCDAPTLKRRAKICKGSNLKIFNANAQTLLESVRDGIDGFCGVMANVHPTLYRILLSGKAGNKEALLQSYLGLCPLLTTYTYPCCAKYYLDKYEGVAMTYEARSKDDSCFNEYQKSCMDQFALMDKEFTKWILEE